jgi:hypothetical protein
MPPPGAQAIVMEVRGPARSQIPALEARNDVGNNRTSQGRQRRQQRGQYRDHRVPLDPAPLLQPPEPPLDGGDPALPVGQHPHLHGQARGGIDVSGRD